MVQVADARGVAAGSSWVASVISTAFTAPSGATIAASAASYDANLDVDTITVGAATLNASVQSNLTDSVAAITATGITGNTSATWNPTITVKVPPGGLAVGVYSATITHSTPVGRCFSLFSDGQPRLLAHQSRKRAQHLQRCRERLI